MGWRPIAKQVTGVQISNIEELFFQHFTEKLIIENKEYVDIGWSCQHLTEDDKKILLESSTMGNENNISSSPTPFCSKCGLRKQKIIEPFGEKMITQFTLNKNIEFTNLYLKDEDKEKNNYTYENIEDLREWVQEQIDDDECVSFLIAGYPLKCFKDGYSDECWYFIVYEESGEFEITDESLSSLTLFKTTMKNVMPNYEHKVTTTSFLLG
jgi:hypothetical protein